MTAPAVNAYTVMESGFSPTPCVNVWQATTSGVTVIPSREIWLWRNSVALASVRRGLSELAAGQIVDLGSFVNDDDSDDDE